MAGKQTDGRAGLADQLREAIRGSDQSLNRLAHVTGVDSGRLSRFMTGRRGLTLDALDRIVRALRIRLVAEGPPPSGEPAPKKGRGKAN
jgi:hypothetical protein